jgi:hypothetical protein
MYFAVYLAVSNLLDWGYLPDYTDLYNYGVKFADGMQFVFGKTWNGTKFAGEKIGVDYAAEKVWNGTKWAGEKVWNGSVETMKDFLNWIYDLFSNRNYFPGEIE